jgi:Raf kinase inhibitor-like YbhB/YbcL family protein
MTARTIALLAGLSLVVAVGCRREAAPAAGAAAGVTQTPEQEVAAMGMKITSPAFAQDQSIPRVHTCDGRDLSPSLAWDGIPPGTQSLALVVDDPDAPDPAAPRMTWVHWVLYNLPPDATGLPQGVEPEDLPAGTREGLNDWKRLGYGGPCPPKGRHRYFFKLYALDTRLPNLSAATKAALEQAMAGHIVAKAELVGTYQRQ